MNSVTALCGWFTWKSEDFVKKNEKTWTKALLPTQVELSMWIKEEEGERKKKIKNNCVPFSKFSFYSLSRYDNNFTQNCDLNDNVMDYYY